MKAINSEAGTDLKRLPSRNVSVDFATEKARDEHKLKMRLAYFGMVLVSITFIGLLTLIVLYCAGVVPLSPYVITPLSTGTVGCAATLLITAARYFFSKDKK